MEGRPDVGALAWFAPGISGLIAAGILGALVPWLMRPALILATLFLLFLACLRQLEQSQWRKDLRAKQAHRDKVKSAEKGTRAATKAAQQNKKSK
mmetsp:Transcript_50238/g.116640  ORF Transcript_50238/g.116640 Transcript_50238/m.116640 type:complete len:95 (+) Transcript_50238:65-349(+)